MYTPVANNCTEVPFATDGVAGEVEPCVWVKTMFFRTGASTASRTAGEVIASNVAVILEVPGASPVANPAVLTVATFAVAEFHVTWLVMSPVLPSVYVAIAVNCAVNATVMFVDVSVSAIDWSVATVTVRPKVFDVTPFRVALTFEVPMPAPIARPLAAIATTVGEAEFHVTWLVRFTVLASLYVPVAVN